MAFRQVGAIRSVSEGSTYAYLGTAAGGILRYHLYANRFDDPITPAQGLSSFRITALHVDPHTGILWAATEKYLEYSFTGAGDWRRVDLVSLGLGTGNTIEQIGSSNRYLWCRSGSVFIKLDRTTGIHLGTLTLPDEESIRWSSGSTLPANLSDLLLKYSPTDGWTYDLDAFISPRLKAVKVTTLYEGLFGDLWIGTADGTLFRGERQLLTLQPLNCGIGNNDVMAIGPRRGFWLGGRHHPSSSGITHIDWRRRDYNIFEFEHTLNLDPQSIYAILEVGHEVWFGGEGGLLIYDRKKDFWRSYGPERGFPDGIIRALAQSGDHIWLGSSRGLARIQKEAVRGTPFEGQERYAGVFIYDLKVVQDQVWIGSEFDLHIYDPRSGRWRDFKQLGVLDQIQEQLPLLSAFQVIEPVGGQVYVATAGGILSYDLRSRTWRLVADPAIYRAQPVVDLGVYQDYLFIATKKELIRYNLVKGFIRRYNYEFFGKINALYISSRTVWLGTTEGLIKFAWQKELG